MYISSSKAVCFAQLIGKIALLMTLSLPAFAITEEWAVGYNNPTTNYQDRAASVAIDVNNNVYVTGASYDRVDSGSAYDYLTLKYDAEGNQLWAARYGDRFSQDYGVAIAVDALANVYVTGTSRNGFYDHDFLTVKYDANGNQLWEKRYSGPGSFYYSGSTHPSDDYARGLVLDAQGNVYVTGNSQSSNHTIKYAPDGTVIWERRHSQPSGWGDTPVDIVLDDANNVYITGQTRALCFWCNNSGTYILKLNSDGSEAWRQRTGNQYTSGVALDAQGNVYVGGTYTYVYEWVYRSQTSDYRVLKYTPDGILQWSMQYDAQTSGPYISEYARDFDVDAAGNSYITGSTSRNGTSDFLTVMIDTQGNAQWERLHDGADVDSYDRPVAMTVNSKGNVIVTGQSGAYGTYPNHLVQMDFLTLEYDSNGNKLWEARYNGIADKADTPTAIAQNESGNVVVTGYSTGNSLDDYLTVKYVTNRAPIAIAGQDREIACTGTQTTVSLDGTDSYDPDGDSLSYLWSGAITSSSPTPTATLPVGEHSFLLTVDDGNGGNASDQLDINVAYQFGGFLSPLKAEGVYKQGRVLPIKINLGCLGSFTITNAEPTISVHQLSNGEPTGEPIIIESSSAADNGITFRYAGDHYIYNLSTKNLGIGSYLLEVDLHDGSLPKKIVIKLK